MNICEQFLDTHLAQGRGHRAAVLADDRVHTYADLVGLSVREAARLAADGVKPGDRVILALPDGAGLVGALFGVLRHGAVAVMVNPTLPVEQIRAFADDTGAAAAVVAPQLFSEARALTATGRRLLWFPEGAASSDVVVGGDQVTPAFDAEPGDDAIWQFSSGTSGRPKAVRHSHQAFAVASEAYGVGVLGLRQDDVTLAASKLFFGYAVGSNLLFPFAAGASCILIRERATADAVFDRIRRHRPTVLVSTPAMLRQMVAHPDAGGQDLSSLRLVTSAGEALPPLLHDRWRHRFAVELLDGLGMTEMCHIFISNRPGAVTRGTIGRVLPGYDIRLCDADGVDVPDGAPGELWVRGGSRAIGYWQRPEEDARVFRGDWCVAGDMLRRNADGTVSYCGRVDEMLKVNGRWVAPRAVEECLLAHPDVREAVVVGVADGDGLIRPHAFVVATRTGRTLGEEIRAFARTRLEPHACPRDVVFIDTLPRTAQGKVDRRALSQS